MKETMLEIAKRVDAFFAGHAPVHATLRRLDETLREMKIPFAFSGDMAVNAHGHRQTASKLEFLMRREDLDRFKEKWIGLGWADKFEGFKGFRDTQNNVTVDVVIVGHYPGDGLA